MSKTLSKVLVICALAVLLPLTIVGTAFAAYYSVDNVVNVAVMFLNNQKAVGDDYFAMIEYDGEKLNSVEVKTGHTKTISVAAAYSEKAYNFVGWFNGTEAEYKAAGADVKIMSKDRGLNIKMEDGGNYLAVYDVVKFNVALSYQTAAEQAEADYKQIEEKTYVYGEALPDVATLEDAFKGEGYVYSGWKQDNQVYTHATFAKTNTTVALVNTLNEQQSYTITYKFNGQEKQVSVWESNEFVDLATIADGMFETDFAMKAGYKYYWYDTDANNAPDNFVPNKNYTFELKEEAISYSASLGSFKDVKETSADAVTLNLESDANFDAWLSLTPKYSFWRIIGLTYNDTTYSKTGTTNNFNALRDAYIADQVAGIEKSINLAVEKDYATFTHDDIKFSASKQAVEIGSLFNLKVYDANTAYSIVENGDVETSNELPSSVSPINSNTTISDLLLLDELGTKEGYTDAAYYTVYEEDGVKVAHALKFFGFRYTRSDGSKGIIKFAETDTINDVIEKILDNIDHTNGASTIAITGLTALFVVA